jgi:hypothetical protein
MVPAIAIPTSEKCKLSKTFGPKYRHIKDPDFSRIRDSEPYSRIFDIYNYELFFGNHSIDSVAQNFHTIDKPNQVKPLRTPLNDLWENEIVTEKVLRIGSKTLLLAGCINWFS